MSANTFGRNFRVTTFGESHCKALGVIVDGCPANIEFDLEYIQSQMARRRPGGTEIGTKRNEADRLEVLSGVFEGRTDAEVYEEYFLETLENVKRFSGFQTLGHLDYVVRYGARQAEEYSYSRYADIIDEILKILVQRGCGLELNTGGIKYGLGFPNPHPDILRRFRELGGDIVTVGADAHRPEHVGYAFEQVREYLKNAGFAYVAEFQGRKPEFIKI